MIDPNAYGNRLRELKKLRAEEKTRSLKTLYEEAISLTETALRVHALLQDAASEFFEVSAEHTRRRLDLQEERQKRYQKELARLVKDVEAPAGAFLRSSAKLSAQLVKTALATDFSSTNTAIHQLRSTATVQVALKLIEQLHNEIFGQELGSFKLEVAIESLNTVIGLVPLLGNIYAGIVASVNVARRRKRRGAAASKHVAALEDYCDALKSWIAMAGATIDVLQVEVE